MHFSRFRAGFGAIVIAVALVSWLVIPFGFGDAGRAAHADSPPPSRSLSAGDSSAATLLIFGDAGTGDALQARVAEAMVKVCTRLACDAGLVTGDLLYTRDALTGPSDPRLDAILRQPYSKLAARSGFRLYAVAGNHDLEAGLGAELAWASGQELWHMPGLDYAVPKLKPWLQIYGLFTPPLYKRRDQSDLITRSLAVGEEPVTPGAGIDSTAWADPGQLARARAALCDPAAEGWRVVFGHHPLVSSAQGESEKLVRELGPMLDECEVDFYIAGHAHQQELRRLGHLVQIIEGAAGSPRTLRTPWYGAPEFLVDEAGFAVLRLWQDEWRVGFFDDRGQLLHEAGAKRSPAPRAPPGKDPA